jgi:hypothetical protein
VIYLMEDTLANRKLIGRYLEVWEYPDGRIELRADGAALPAVPYDRLAQIDQGAVIDHKRLGHALQVAQVLQAQRDDRRASGSPSRTNHGLAVRKPERLPGTKKQREFTRSTSLASIRSRLAHGEDEIGAFPSAISFGGFTCRKWHKWRSRVFGAKAHYGVHAHNQKERHGTNKSSCDRSGADGDPEATAGE